MNISTYTYLVGCITSVVVFPRTMQLLWRRFNGASVVPATAAADALYGWCERLHQRLSVSAAATAEVDTLVYIVLASRSTDTVIISARWYRLLYRRVFAVLFGALSAGNNVIDLVDPRICPESTKLSRPRDTCAVRHCTGWSKKNGATLHFPKYLENYWR